jgi:hypothetical protein
MGLENNYSKANNHGLPEGQVQKLPTEVEGRKMQKPYSNRQQLDLPNHFGGLPSSFSLKH